MDIGLKQSAVIDWLIEDDRFGNISSISKSKLDEKIRLGSKDRESINDRTGTDYSKAFDALHKNIDRLESVSDGIYKNAGVAKEDQIATAIIPLIESILDKYMVELEEMENANANALIPTFTKNVANIINQWVMQISKLESNINQHHNLKIKGREVVAKFIQEVYEPTVNYTNMISKLVKDGKAQVDEKGINVKFDNIMKEIDDKSKAFYDSVNTLAQSQKGVGTAKMGIRPEPVLSNP